MFCVSKITSLHQGKWTLPFIIRFLQNALFSEMRSLVLVIMYTTILLYSISVLVCNFVPFHFNFLQTG